MCGDDDDGGGGGGSNDGFVIGCVVTAVCLVCAVLSVAYNGWHVLLLLRLLIRAQIQRIVRACQCDGKTKND